MDNIEKSGLVIAKVLGILAERGLAGGNLSFEDIGLEEDYKPFFDTAIDWLIEEKLIRAKNIARVWNGIALVVTPTLTARGMAIMQLPLRIGSQESTVGQTVRETAKDTTFYTNLTDAAGGFVGGLLKSLASG